MSNKVAEIVTNAIMEKMKEGKIPWHKPWKGHEAVNYVTQKPYRGINTWLLEEGEYITFKQLSSIKGAKLKEGAKSHIVVFYKPLVIKNEETTPDGDEEEILQQRFMLRYYKVFNINDCEGIESKRVPTEQRAFTIEDCESLCANYLTTENIHLTHEDTTSAFYSPVRDYINIPPIECFDSSEGYYATTFHEMAHSTGHEKRLKRDMSGKFGTKAYAREELVAEISSAMLCDIVGISTEGTLDNSTAYIQNWLGKLEDDVNLILYASAKAEKAVELIAPQYFSVVDVEVKLDLTDLT